MTPDTYLKALALHTMAREHIRQAEAFRAALAKLLERDGDPNSLSLGHIDDSIYDDRMGFNEALVREGFVIPDPTHDLGSAPGA